MFTGVTLEKFSLSPEDVIHTSESKIWIKKWNWDYARAHAFQKHAVDLLTEHPRLRIFIMCNHPRVFTNGRGLQKARKGQTLDLVDFNPADAEMLPYPFFQIERGGGLTFHHPGQFVFYPILKLNPQRLSLSRMIDDVFNHSMDALSDWGLSGLSTENALMGIWKEHKKIASMGIAIEKLTTFHGMALNISGDPEMVTAMKKLNPCGISPETYAAVDEFISVPPHPIEFFSNAFMTRINDAWK